MASWHDEHYSVGAAVRSTPHSALACDPLMKFAPLRHTGLRVSLVALFALPGCGRTGLVEPPSFEGLDADAEDAVRPDDVRADARDVTIGGDDANSPSEPVTTCFSDNDCIDAVCRLPFVGVSQGFCTVPCSEQTTCARGWSCRGIDPRDTETVCVPPSLCVNLASDRVLQTGPRTNAPSPTHVLSLRLLQQAVIEGGANEIVVGGFRDSGGTTLDAIRVDTSSLVATSSAAVLPRAVSEPRSLAITGSAPFRAFAWCGPENRGVMLYNVFSNAFTDEQPLEDPPGKGCESPVSAGGYDGNFSIVYDITQADGTPGLDVFYFLGGLEQSDRRGQVDLNTPPPHFPAIAMGEDDSTLLVWTETVSQGGGFFSTIRGLLLGVDTAARLSVSNYASQNARNQLVWDGQAFVAMAEAQFDAFGGSALGVSRISEAGEILQGNDLARSDVTGQLFDASEVSSNHGDMLVGRTLLDSGNVGETEVAFQFATADGFYDDEFRIFGDRARLTAARLSHVAIVQTPVALDLLVFSPVCAP